MRPPDRPTPDGMRPSVGPDIPREDQRSRARGRARHPRRLFLALLLGPALALAAICGVEVVAGHIVTAPAVHATTSSGYYADVTPTVAGGGGTSTVMGGVGGGPPNP